MESVLSNNNYITTSFCVYIQMKGYSSHYSSVHTMFKLQWQIGFLEKWNQRKGSIRGSCSLAIAIPVHRHVGHITWTTANTYTTYHPHLWFLAFGPLGFMVIYTFPAPEQFEHLSVLDVDTEWFPPAIAETGSATIRAPVLEQRAHARYPALLHKEKLLKKPKKNLNLFMNTQAEWEEALITSS